MRVFVSYRRTDSAGWAGRLVDALIERFRPKNIFHDLEIEPGENWPKLMTNALQKVDYILVVIGPKWANVVDEQGKRRLDNPNDVVRKEVATALRREKSLIPVLVGGARMPPEAELPSDLKPLAHRQAFELQEQRWNQDVQALLTMLGGRVWWRKILLASAGLIQVSFLGLWIYTGVLENVISTSEAQSVEIRNDFIKKVQVGTDECMDGVWPKGAVKGKTYKENGDSVTELCSRVSGSLNYFGRFFNDDSLWRMTPSLRTADAFASTYDQTFNKDFEPFLTIGWTAPPSNEARTLAHRAAADLAIQANKLVQLKRNAGSAAARLDSLSIAVLIGKLWTLMMLASVIIWLIRRSTRFSLS